VHHFLRQEIWQEDASLLPQERPPYAQLVDSMLATALEAGADTIRLVPQGDVVEFCLQVEAHWQTHTTFPSYVMEPLCERFEKMTGKRLAHPAAVQEATIPVWHEKDYILTVGYVSEETTTKAAAFVVRLTGDDFAHRD
jgi:type II secretory ATPase GspE/PulE/Tfp pilus assembly ATPase PilB-like protein